MAGFGAGSVYIHIYIQICIFSILRIFIYIYMCVRMYIYIYRCRFLYLSVSRSVCMGFDLKTLLKKTFLVPGSL